MSQSRISKSLIQPFFTPNPSGQNSIQISSLIAALNLQGHLEGGYFNETDRDPSTVPSPFPSKPSNTSSLAPQRPGFDPLLRNASTTIFYLLTPNGPQGGFHRNAGRTVHTLHRGRGRYVIIHADEEVEGEYKRVETFVVGQDVERGEKPQWVVPGGKYKASFLLPDEEGGRSSEGLLISETVVPGFEFCDHDFLTKEGLRELVGEERAGELKWLLWK
jgi:predicted cupin superfamily sugar epimerase